MSPAGMPARHSELAAQLSASLMTPAVCKTRGSGAEPEEREKKVEEGQGKMEHTIALWAPISAVIKINNFILILFKHCQAEDKMNKAQSFRDAVIVN